jgi:hypothetical protein
VPSLRRAEEGRGHTETTTMRQGRRPQPPPRGGKRRPSALGRGVEPEQEHPHRQGRLHRPEHLRHATIYPEPATTTPPPHREHRPATLSLLPLGLFPVMNRRRRDAPPVKTCLDAVHRAAGLLYRNEGGS